MSNIVDRLNIVASLGANTGRVTGDVRMQRPKHILLTNGWEPTNADLLDAETLADALQEAMLLSRTDTNKVFLLTGFHEVEDNTGDPNVATLQDGYEEVLNEAIPKYTLRHTAPVGQTQEMVAFNGFAGRAYIIDSAGVFWYVGKDGGGGHGFDVSYFYANYPRFGGSGAINTGIVKITLGNIDQFKNNVGAVSVQGVAITELVNMVDVKLEEIAAASGYAFKIGGKTYYAGTDIYDTYKDLLAVVGAWKATLVSDGSNITIASVAKDTVNRGWTVTLGSTPTISTGAAIKLELVDPTALAALTTPVEGIESIYVKVLKAA